MPKQTKPWFKFYSGDWLEDTRMLSLEQRGAYIDCIAIIMDTDKPIPDDIKWLSHKLHVSTRKAGAIRELLVKAQKLVKTNSGFDNDKCREVRFQRAERSKTNTENAKKKAKKKRQNQPKTTEETHPENQFSSPVQPQTNAEPTLNQQRTNAEPTPKQTQTNSENSKKLNKINDTERISLSERSYTRACAETDTEIDIDKRKKTSSSKEKVDDDGVGLSHAKRSIDGLNGSTEYILRQVAIWFWRDTLPAVTGDEKEPGSAVYDQAEKYVSGWVEAVGAEVFHQAFMIVFSKVASGEMKGNPVNYLNKITPEMKQNAEKRKVALDAARKSAAVETHSTRMVRG